MLVLFVIAVLVYLPGIDAGMPEATVPGTTRSWIADELGPIGPIVEPMNAFHHQGEGNPQYPMFHYFFLLLVYLPYLAFQLLTGGLAHPHAGYPFGFRNPAGAVRTLLLISRGVSVVMGGAVVAMAYLTASKLWDRWAGRISAVCALLMYPMYYYARTSNVDVPGLFWFSLVLYVFVRILQDGLTTRRAVWVGVFSALAVATKDLNYALIVMLPMVFLPAHYRRLREAGKTSFWEFARAPLAGGLLSAVLYGFASGLFISPLKYANHLEFIRTGSISYRYYFEFPLTLKGSIGLARRCLEFFGVSMGWPLLLAGVAGALLCLKSERLKLAILLPIPGLFYLALFPVGYVEVRYLMSGYLILGMFAGNALSRGMRARHAAVRWAAVAVLAGGCGVAALRDADIVYATQRDARYTASAWFAQHTRAGDSVEIFSPLKSLVFYPRLPAGLVVIPSEATPSPGVANLMGDFVLVMGKHLPDERWRCPAWVYEGLQNGSLGYLLAARITTPTLYLHPEPEVNPQMEVYVRRDRAAGAGITSRSTPQP